ncbi:type II toxin-antitoxin system VapC family toxin [Amycolatopsis tucumanensis]|uniref:Type II toxin-antitoxin system VapC family toxin n=1 Tax=Amycolatopsis tucumanensis TaxID=401106 RepID=A0ABP7HCG4_9PSEU|nr:type II toxin-antitoxin system VapC family toxin [Amycolatopsis tucumanensis]MCF6423755.1 type II toxin-antitoxin system VapC family toxin [Amycolatopsis tucumanensis]
MGGVTPRRLMLDTHVLLWALTDPARLSDQVRAAVADRRTELFVSAASAWEIATKQRLGKLPQAEVLVRAYRQHLARLAVDSVPVTDEHSLLAGSMEWKHRDPFDRIIAAQCMTESLPLVTADEAFQTVAGVQVLW